MPIQRLTFFLIAVLGVPASHAGSVIELITTEYSQDPPIVGTVEISTLDGNSRIEITSVSSSESGGIIYKPGKKEMIAIDHGAQEYYIIDQAMMDNMARQVSDAVRQMEEALEALPPEQRDLARKKGQFPKSRDAPEPEVSMVKTGESDSIADFDCDYYDVMREGRRIRVLCVTDWADIEEGRQVAEAMMLLADFFESMRQAFSGAGGMGVMDRQQEIFQYMRELDGYPVLARDYDPAGTLELESRIRTAGHVDLQATMFEPPPNYQAQLLQ